MSLRRVLVEFHSSLDSTGRSRERTGRRTLGADDYVTKPIDFDILETIIDALLAGIARNEIWVKRINRTRPTDAALIDGGLC